MEPKQDSTTEQSLPHKLAAILYADVEGYSRLTGADEVGTHRTLTAYLDFFTDTIKAHRGEVKHFAGDAVLADFTTVSDAINCAVAVQKEFKQRNEPLPPEKRVQFRIGLNLGEVIVDRGEVYGNGVNVAARLETLAEPGGICVAGTVVDLIGGKLPYAYEFLGEQAVKNIDKPVRAYRVNFGGAPAATARPAAPIRPSREPQAKKRIWSAAALIVLIVAGAWWAFSRHAPPPQSAGAPTTTRPTAPTASTASSPATSSAASSLQAPKANRIAVLPFANLSSDKENEYFSDGITEEMISKLSRVPGLEVIARTSIMSYKGTTKKITEIAKELNVNTVLEGSVRRTGDKLRITAQLINAANDAHLWSNDYDRDLKDVFAIQSEVARSVAEALRVTLNPASVQQINKRGTENLEAYDLYLQGLYHQNKFSPDGLQTSLDYFNKAAALDSKFARLHAAIGISYELLGSWGIQNPKEAYAKSKAAARRALDLDDSLVEGHVVVADMAVSDLDWPLVESSYKRALALDPRSTVTLDAYAILYLSPWGRHDESVNTIRRAIEVDPHSLLYRTDLAIALMVARRYDEAITEAKSVLTREPTASQAWWAVGWASSQKGLHDTAIAAFEKRAELTGQSFESLGALGYAYARAAKRNAALKILSNMTDRAKKETFDPVGFAFVYLGLDDKDAALKWLERTYDERPNVQLAFLKVWSTYDSLRPDPRFIALLKKVGLEK